MSSKMTANSSLGSALRESLAELVSDELVALLLAKLGGEPDNSEADEDSHRLGYAKSGKDGFAVIGKTGGVPLKVVKQTPSESKNGNVVTIKPAKKTSKKSTKPSPKVVSTPTESDEHLAEVLLASPRNAKFLCCSEGTKFGKPTGKACGAWFANKAKALEHKTRFGHFVTTKAVLRDALAEG